jgi:hypothetical protein
MSSVPVSILPFLVIVIGRTRAGSHTRADECTFPAANQPACTSTDRRADSDSFRGLLFPGFRISMMCVLAVRNWNCERETEHQQ